jgi:hypothetical protein
MDIYLAAVNACIVVFQCLFTFAWGGIERAKISSEPQACKRFFARNLKEGLYHPFRNTLRIAEGLWQWHCTAWQKSDVSDFVK